MMRISTQTSRFTDYYGLKKTVDILSDAGFEALDLSAYNTEFCTDVHNKEFYVDIKKYAEEEKGVCFNQAHAPHPSSDVDLLKTKEIFDTLITAMKNASYLGAENIIIHPCQHLNYYEEGNKEKLYEINMEFYRSLIPYCEEYGIKVATENMWQYPGMISHSTCSKPEEFIQYVDGISSPWIVGCLDIGHTVLVREQPDEFIKKLGSSRLKCLHVHDVDGVDDLHTFPYFGITDWDSVMKALAEIGYEGDLTFEANGLYTGKPYELYPHYASLLAATGKHLRSIFNSYLQK